MISNGLWFVSFFLHLIFSFHLSEWKFCLHPKDRARVLCFSENVSMLIFCFRYTVGKISGTPEPMAELNQADFGSRAGLRVKFPKCGTALTPPHQSADFRWKDYCPMVFRLAITLSSFPYPLRWSSALLVCMPPPQFVPRATSFPSHAAHLFAIS